MSKEFVDPMWVVGDATEMDKVLEGEYHTRKVVDLVFTCPPYYDLERYSEDPADLSNADTYEEFMRGFGAAMAGAVARLRNNRFVVIVVGELRGKFGACHGFVPDTIKLMQSLGCPLYNEGVFITPVGSLPVRAGKPFSLGRKLGKAHQNLLVFYKGDPRKIKMVFPTTLPVADLPGLLEPDDGPGESS
jgi:hypothetical protein